MKSSRISQAIVAAGGAFVALGYLSPWAVVDPNHEGPVADIKFWRQNVAFELDYLEANVLTLLPLLLTGVLFAWNPKSRVSQVVGVLSGLFYISLPFYYRMNIVRLHHVPTDIIYSVLVGGVLILVGVGFAVLTDSVHKAQ
ncbi:hypothetical protein E6P09_19230 (plasmid) [Haloferax mediterranei ATCC 33500]|uniref:Uncharacterized protein n=1 Tax=Haloferax mediterranei (strain ATCC 33500 / DSM 1411 / JCM 8866 / NBRC 14739 / NCIMB 2177 / R-4) TaxID=523841 RepID=A0A4P8P8H5_HALMT|nr:hypothetical protein [Haloferax mediterranei]MDX5989657.1 hypothetical protein [Haloferax mediterranei ATCC 33500]QCQ77443.1 hypothetical protein E6P09_19230 [Haloferax mediterranei ATCC 33500]